MAPSAIPAAYIAPPGLYGAVATRGGSRVAVSTPAFPPTSQDLEGRICALEEIVELLMVDVQDAQARLQWPCLEAKFQERLYMCEARLGLGMGSGIAINAGIGTYGMPLAYCDRARTDALQHDVAELGEAVEALRVEDLAGQFEQLRCRVAGAEAGLAELEALGLRECASNAGSAPRNVALGLPCEAPPQAPATKVDSKVGQEAFDRLRGELAAFTEALSLRSSVSSLEEKAAHTLSEVESLAQRVSLMEASSVATVEEVKTVTRQCEAAVERFRDSERLLQEVITQSGGHGGCS
mmetsp:Transcript_70694/g.206994  ORF Transcript_70694/g.206994 Transcript_70694/m.206994 type:complete len:295 (-) Transcript_70694:84-968(-)